MALALLAASGRSLASNEAGLPLFASLRGRDLGRDGGHVDAQMFSFEQDSRGILYVANNAGVLVYDGSRWLTVPVARGATVLSLAVGRDDTIWVGGSGTFGKLARGPRGELVYQPLDGLLPADAPQVGDVWDALVLDGATVFRSPAALYVVRRENLEVIRPRNVFHLARVLHGRLYVRDDGVGLLTLDENGKLVLAPDGDLLADLRPYVMLPYDPTRLLLGTSDALYLFDPRPDVPRARRLVRFRTDADSWLAESQLYTGTLLSGRGFALGTLRGGVVVVDPGGETLWQAGRRHGLRDDTVLAAFEDQEGNLWLGFNDGLSVVEAASGLTQHGEASGLAGFVEAVARSQGRLYAATALGVWRLEAGGPRIDGGGFVPIPAISEQTWTLLDTGGSLLAGGNDRVYEIRGLDAAPVLEGETYALAPGARSGRVWAAQDRGVAWLDRTAEDDWRTGRLEGVAGPIRHVVEQPAGTLWLGTEYGELLRVEVANGAAADVRRYGRDDGMPEAPARPLVFGEDLLVAADGLYRFDPSLARFARDTRFPDSFEGAHGLALCPLPDGPVVVSADHRTMLLAPTGERFETIGSLVERVPLGNRLLSCLVEDPVVWLGTDDGLFRWDRDAEHPRRSAAAVQLRFVTRGEEGVLAADLGSGTTSLPPIRWARTPLRFDFSLPSLVAADRNEYRTLLEGFETEWTPWTHVASREFTNLPPGHYRLRVQGRNVRREAAREATLAFAVTPPWYRSTAAYFAYAALAVGALFVGGQLQVRQVRRRNLELERLVAERTVELRNASITDPLTGLHNRRFFDQVVPAELATLLRARRDRPRPGAPELLFFLIDLDYFKRVNDELGHAEGDQLLVQVATRLRTASREGDLLFRWGGEELLLVTRDTRRESAVEIARRLLHAIGDEPMRLGGESRIRGADAEPSTWRLTCSVGAAPLPFFEDAPDAATLDDILRWADAALYRAKRVGRNRAVCVEPALPFPQVREGWPDWLRQSIGDSAASWLRLTVIEGPPTARVIV